MQLILITVLSGILLMPIPGVTREEAYQAGYNAGRGIREAVTTVIDNAADSALNSVDWSKYLVD